MAVVFSFLSRWFSSPKQQPKEGFRFHRDSVEWLVVGLGNPGKKYETTRHNVGFLTADVLSEGLVSTTYNKAVIFQNDTMLVLKPLTFMNLSGEAVGPLARECGVPVEKIIVIHDELDLGEGLIRIKQGGGENGHNGLKSLTDCLGSRDYIRVRIGIGRPPKGTSVTDWVLSQAPEEVLKERTDRAAEAVRLIVDEGLAKAQNVIHAEN